MHIPILNRRFNPVVDRFVTTDLALQAIIAQTSPSPPPPIQNAISLLSDCLDGRLLARDAIQAAKEIPLKGQDPELAILLLSRWAELAARLSNPSEAETLLHQARALFSGKTHPEIVATVHFSMSVLEEARGNHQEREGLLRRIAADLPEHSPRRKFYLWELGLLLARQGRGIEFKMEMLQLTWQTSERFPLEQLDRLHFIDAVETGRIRAAAERMSTIAVAAVAPVSASAARALFREYQQLLSLMHHVGQGPVPPPTGLPEKTADDRPPTADRAANSQPPTPDPQHPPPTQRPSPTAQGRWDRDLADYGYTPVWIQTVHALLTGDAPGALKLARLEAKRLMASIFGTGFGSFNLIRAELASGNAEAARRLLEMRRTRGNTHYLDCFFAARCDLLAGQRREAIAHFREALAAIEQHDARGRMDFELRLATELPKAEVIELTREAAARPAGVPAPPVHAPVPILPPRSTPAETAIIGHSAAILGLHETIRQIAALDTPVLITGETGTGKELVAAALHRQGTRAGKPFVAINCSAISETLLESELFGHERGSFTGADRTTHGLFEDAGEGTLLLDEIGDVSPRLQAVLLRVLESGEIRAIGSTRSRQIHCRILAATNADLERRVAEGSFRQDMLYRLQRLTIHIPPLRERREDILPLTRHFLDEGRAAGTHATVSPAFSATMRTYDWPGNVRELRNVIERMRLTHSDKLYYDAADLDIRRPPGQMQPGAGTPRAVPAADMPTTPPAPPIHQPAASHPPSEVSAFLRSGHSPLRRLERLEELFTEHRRLTRAEVVHLLGISPNTATKYLQSLCEEGYIRCVEPSASSRSRYFEIA
jgi:DNA-binding NtrC family response regulator